MASGIHGNAFMPSTESELTTSLGALSMAAGKRSRGIPVRGSTDSIAQEATFWLVMLSRRAHRSQASMR